MVLTYLLNCINKNNIVAVGLGNGETPGVAATRHVRPAVTAPAATALLLLQLMVLL